MLRLSPTLLLLLVSCGGGGDDPVDGDCGAMQVLINEVLVDAPGSDEGFEWIELINVGGDDVDLSYAYIGWTKSESSTGETVGFPEGTILEAGQHLLVGEADVDEVHVEVDLDLGQGSGGDGVYLYNACGEALDALIYGDSNEDNIPDESGSKAVSYAPKPGSGETLARCSDGSDGVDSDDSAADFIVMGEESITPGLPNVCPCESMASDVRIVINEAMINPAGSDGGYEWIELLNVGSEDACLDLWTLGVFKSDPLDPTEKQLPVGMNIPAGGRLLIAEDSVDFEADAYLSLSFGNGTEGDAIHLYDPTGELEDTLVYGDTNEDGCFDENGVATSLAPEPGSDITLARCPDGADTNASGADFQACMVEGGTPGLANDACCGGGAGSCDEAGSANLVINEFMADPGGADAGLEWIEIYNAGNGSVDASGWRLSWFKSNPDSASGSVALPSDTIISSRGYLLVAGESVSGADVQASLDLGNGTDGDGLHLSDCNGTLADAVVYGPNNDDGIYDENGVASSVAADPGSDDALARSPDGTDSDRSGNDFCVAASATPGASNSGCE
jgi:hypothetical protein